MSEKTYYQRNRDRILNIAKDYYENDKEDSESKQGINTEIYLKKEINEKKKCLKSRYNNMPEQKEERLIN